MDIPRLPIWSAYLVAPLLLLAICAQAMWESDTPGLIAAVVVVVGLACAVVLHGYVGLKRLLLSGRSTDRTQGVEGNSGEQRR